MYNNRNINILYVVQPKYIGGAEIQLLNIINNLDTYNFNVFVFSYKDGAVVNLFKKHKIKTKIISLKYWPNARKKLLNFINKNNIDLVHTITPSIFEGAMAAKLACIPHIWHIHADLKNIYPDLKPNQIKNILKMIYSLSTIIVVCSKYVKTQFEEIGLKSNIVTVNNGIDTNLFRHSCDRTRSRFREKFKIARDDLLVGMIGRLDPQKRHQDFIKAAGRLKKKFPKLKFIIVGGQTTKDYLAQLKKINQKLENPVIFAGFNDNQAEVIDSLNILVLPSVGEAAGLVILEAMACNKPVIGANSGGIPDLVLDGKTGVLVPPKSPNEISKAIIRLLEKPEKIRLMGKYGRERVKKFYDIKQITQRIQDIYFKIVTIKGGAKFGKTSRNGDI